MSRRDKLSTIATSHPRADRSTEVGQPQNPSPPKMMTRIAPTYHCCLKAGVPKRAAYSIRSEKPGGGLHETARTHRPARRDCELAAELVLLMSSWWRQLSMDR